MYAIVGFIIVLVSYFILPFKFMTRSYRELSEIGRRGRVDIDDNDELPLLNWVLVLGRCLISVGAVLFYLFLILAAASADDENSGAAMVLAILFGPLLVIAFIWFWGLFLEFISLQIVVARNTRLTHEAIRGGPAPVAGSARPAAPAPVALASEPAAGMG